MHVRNAFLEEYNLLDWFNGPVAEFLDVGDLIRPNGMMIFNVLQKFFNEFAKLLVTIVSISSDTKFICVPTNYINQRIRRRNQRINANVMTQMVLMTASETPPPSPSSISQRKPYSQCFNSYQHRGKYRDSENGEEPFTQEELENMIRGGAPVLLPHHDRN